MSDDHTQVAEPAAEDSPEALREMFAEIVSGDSSEAKEKEEAEDTPAPTPEKGEDPAPGAESEAHREAVPDEKDREIERLRNQIAGVLPRYEALQKEHRDRVAREKAQSDSTAKPALTDEQKASIRDFGEVGELLLQLTEQVDSLSKLKPELEAKAAGLDDIRAEVEERKLREAEEARKSAEAEDEKRLSTYHADWKEVSKSKGFEQFVATLPPAERQELSETANPRIYASYLSDYKATLSGQSIADIQSSRQRRLNNANTPAGRQTSPQSESTSEVEAIFKKVLNESLAKSAR